MQMSSNFSFTLRIANMAVICARPCYKLIQSSK